MGTKQIITKHFQMTGSEVVLTLTMTPNKQGEYVATQSFNISKSEQKVYWATVKSLQKLATEYITERASEFKIIQK